MATISIPTGNGSAISEQKNDILAPIQWVTQEEAEKLDKLMFKPFVRKKELKPGDNKKFFYKVTGVCPYAPLYHNGKEILASSTQNLIEFTVDRFHRNETIVSRRREGGVEIEEEVNKPVARNKYDEKSGTWELADEDTSFKIDSRKFLELFERDRE